MRLSLSLCYALGLAAVFLDFQSGVLATSHGDHADSEHGTEDHADSEHDTEDHAEEEHGTEDHAEEEHGTEDHAEEEHGTEDHAGEEHSTEDHAEEEHSTEDHAEEEHGMEDHADSEHATGYTCPSELGWKNPVSLPGLSHKEGGKPVSFLSRASWHPVKDLKVTAKDPVGLQFGSPNFGYTTLVGDNGFPQYYQLDKVTLTTPKHITPGLVENYKYNFEIQISSFRQETVWKYDMNDMVVTSFFFTAKENSEKGNYNSTFLKQIIDAHNLHGDVITTPAGVDLQRAFGPQLNGAFYAYRTESDTCPRATWYVFTQPITMSFAQMEELQSIYPGLTHHDADDPKKVRECMQNTFIEGEPVHYDFYLDRDTGRNRRQKGEYLILVPIFGTILLASAVMSSLFVTDKADGDKVEMMTKGGLVPSIIGSPTYP